MILGMTLREREKFHFGMSLHFYSLYIIFFSGLKNPLAFYTLMEVLDPYHLG